MELLAYFILFGAPLTYALQPLAASPRSSWNHSCKFKTMVQVPDLKSVHLSAARLPRPILSSHLEAVQRFTVCDCGDERHFAVFHKDDCLEVLYQMTYHDHQIGGVDERFPSLEGSTTCRNATCAASWQDPILK